MDWDLKHPYQYSKYLVTRVFFKVDLGVRNHTNYTAIFKSYTTIWGYSDYFFFFRGGGVIIPWLRRVTPMS